MWRTLLAYVYALAVAVSFVGFNAHNDDRAPLFWRDVLAHFASGGMRTPPPSVLCGILERARVERDEALCGAAPKPAAQPAP